MEPTTTTLKVEERRGHCFAALSRTPHTCSCAEFVRGRYSPEYWGWTCQKCLHTQGVHTKTEAAA